MRWFLERISARSLPIQLGIKERTEHPDDFAKLVQRKVLKHVSNLDSVECGFCADDEKHECQVRNNKGKLSYVCDNGNGKKDLTDEDVAIFEYSNDNFLKVLTNELGIMIDRGSHKDEAAYSDDAFYRLGTYEDKQKKMQAEAYYLRNSDAFEPSILFEKLGNKPKVLITNTLKADLVTGKENLYTCVLADILAPANKKHLFDKRGLVECFDVVRRVRFDKNDGHLFLDEKLVYTAGLGSPEYYFLTYLWDNWMKQKTHDDIYQSVREHVGSGVADRPQVFCPKMKSNIKKKCTADINTIIQKPTTGHYMMADPVG